MSQRINILVSNDVHTWLKKNIGKGNVSRFMNNLILPYLQTYEENTLLDLYQSAASDPIREKEAEEWGEAQLTEEVDEAW